MPPPPAELPRAASATWLSLSPWLGLRANSAASLGVDVGAGLTRKERYEVGILVGLEPSSPVLVGDGHRSSSALSAHAAGWWLPGHARLGLLAGGALRSFHEQGSLVIRGFIPALAVHAGASLPLHDAVHLEPWLAVHLDLRSVVLWRGESELATLSPWHLRGGLALRVKLSSE